MAKTSNSHFLSFVVFEGQEFRKCSAAGSGLVFLMQGLELEQQGVQPSRLSTPLCLLKAFPYILRQAGTRDLGPFAAVLAPAQRSP